MSEVPHHPFQRTVGMRPLPALGRGDPRGYYQDPLPAREDPGLPGLLASCPAAPPPALMLHQYLIPQASPGQTPPSLWAPQQREGTGSAWTRESALTIKGSSPTTSCLLDSAPDLCWLPTPTPRSSPRPAPAWPLGELTMPRPHGATGQG